MADIAIANARNIRIVDSVEARTTTAFAFAAVTAGQACFIHTDGTARLAKGDAKATAKVAGIATHNAAAGQPVTLLHYGRLAGFTLGDAGELAYLSKATAGALADAKPASTGYSNNIGQTMYMTDGLDTAVLFVDISLGEEPATY